MCIGERNKLLWERNVMITGGGGLAATLSDRFRFGNSRLQKRAMYLTIKSKLLFLLKRQLIPTKKTLPLLSSTLKNIATQMTDDTVRSISNY
jgi:hypothetical protein